MSVIRRLVPRSLTGQIALLVAVALFVAQAINFALLLRERRAYRFSQVTAPAITRVVDAAERLRDGRFRNPPESRERAKGRLRLQSANPIEPGLEPRLDVEEGLRQAMRESNIPVGRIVTGLRPISPTDPRFARMNAVRAERMKRMGAELGVAVEIPGKGWLTMTTGWPRTERSLIWQLIAQTLILYAVVLIPVLWIGHRVARPLRKLAAAARDFNPADPGEPVEERGPGDVRAVIAAYNTLSRRVTAMLDEYRKRRDSIHAWLTAIPGIQCVKPKGAFYLFPNISGLLSPDGVRTSAEFAQKLIEQEHVVVTPGEAFDAPGYLRISYATSMEALREGATRIQRFAESLQPAKAASR